MKGITAMLSELFGYNSDDPTVCFGKKISSLSLSDEVLRFTFTDKSELDIFGVVRQKSQY